MFPNFQCITELQQDFSGGQWMRIPLPMQEARLRPLVLGDPTCLAATKPGHRKS